MKTRTLQHPAGGEWELATSLLAEQADAYVMHGDDPTRVARHVQDEAERSDNERADAAKTEPDEPMWVLPW